MSNELKDKKGLRCDEEITFEFLYQAWVFIKPWGLDFKVAQEYQRGG